MNNNYDTSISFFIAEVLDIPNIETYTLKTQRDGVDNLHHVYEIACKIVSPDPYSPTIYNVKPADINFKKIPLVGEQVLIFQGYREDSNIDQLNTQQWYYLTTLSVLSNTNINAITGLSRSGKLDSKPGTSFIEKDVSTLQAYEGDLLVEGRFGNSIRFGSSFDISKAKVDVKPNYLGNPGSPIIILSNRKQAGSKFVVENVLDDESSLYLTSKQKITNFSLGSKNNQNSLECYTPGESQFANSQLIGIADRIILKAKTDVAIIDSERAIILNTTGDIKLGNDTAAESMVHGDVLLTILQKIINQLNGPIQCGTMSGTFIDKSNIASAQKLFQKLLSSKYFIDKNTY